MRGMNPSDGFFHHIIFDKIILMRRQLPLHRGAYAEGERRLNKIVGGDINVQ